MRKWLVVIFLPLLIRGEVYWVYFKDKPNLYNERPLYKVFSKNAIERRKGVREKVFDKYDFPINSSYIKIISSMGGILKTSSSWLNACSFIMDEETAQKVSKLSFVKKVHPVKIFKQKIKTIDIDKRVKTMKIDTAFYGLSYYQLAMFDIPKVHKKGYYGDGVKIGFLDTGIKKNHPAFKSIKLVEEHDFLAPDGIYLFKRGKYECVLDNLFLVDDLNLSQVSDGLYLTFIKDSFPTYPPPKRTQRQGFFTYSKNGKNWKSPQKFTIKEFAKNLRTSSSDTLLFAVWEESDSPASPTRISYALFSYGNLILKGVVSEEGEYPSSHLEKDTIYIAFIKKGWLLLKKGAVKKGEIEWVEDLKIFHFSQGNPMDVKITFYDTWMISVVDMLSSVIYTFTPVQNASISLKGVTAYTLAVYDKKNHLFVGGQKNKGFYLSHFVWENGWVKKEDIILNMDLIEEMEAIPEKMGLILQSFGRIYKVEVKDGNWTQPELISQQDFCYHPSCAVRNNETLITWVYRGDDETDYEEGEDNLSQPYHGTKTLGIVGGDMPFHYVGIAPAASFYMAKTEKVKDINELEYEIQVEEDTWIAGLEWLERKGVDIVSSSLGYSDWYEYEDMDGKTAPVSIAAHLASQRGVIIVNAMGNVTKDRPYMVAPADAEGVISVGGIKPDSTWWGPFNNSVGSAIGPTYDGRLKPELVALADSVMVLNPDPTEYGIIISGGTSFSTAIVTGIFALLLDGHPEWKRQPEKAKQALLLTASNANSPNDTLGYGLPNALKALEFYLPPTKDSFFKDEFVAPYPNPFYLAKHKKIYFPFRLSATSPWVSIFVYSISGKLIFKKELQLAGSSRIPVGRYETTEILEKLGSWWDGKDNRGNNVPSGFYIVVLETISGRDLTKISVLR